MADPQPSSVSGVLRRPFAEQVAFFRGKLGNLVPTQFWDDLQKSQHDRAFMVAGATKADLLASFAAAIDRAQAEGTGFGAFKKDFRSIVARHGWTGWTGEETAAGRAWRMRTIFVTNTKTAYHAGRLAQLRDGGFAFWVYRHSDAVRHPRLIHVSWNGLTLPADHPAWRTHYPPNGWGCECYIVGARTLAGARRMGGKPDMPLPASWGAVDPATGEPPGIDRGWGYMPGDSVDADVREMAAKTQQWEYSLAKAYMRSVPDGVRDQLVTEYRALPSVADDVRRYAQQALTSPSAEVAPYRTVGLLSSDQVDQVRQATGQNVAGFDFALDASGVAHVRKQHGGSAAEESRGQSAVTADDYALLPQLINEADSVQSAGDSDVGRSVVRFSKVIGGRRLTAAFEVRARRKMLVLQSFWIGRPGATPP